MDNFLIYKIIFPNGKHYIGLSTRTLDERKKEHRYGASVDKPKQILHKALKKFDMIDTFELILIDNTAKSIDELYVKEIFYIQQYNSYYKNNKGYNMTLGGEGNHGYVYTKADRKKMSQKTIEHFSNPEAREQRSQIIKAYFHNNPEAGEKARERAIRHFSNPEAREQMSQIKKEHYKNNPEAGKVHGEKMKALYENNPEARKKEKYRKLFKVFRKDTMEFIKEFEYQFEAIEYIKKEFNINVSRQGMSAVLRNREKSRKGFVFEYI
jgi:hypothetical protein